MRLLTGLSTDHLNMSILKRTSTPGKYPADNYMFKFNNRNIRTKCEICSELTIKTLERGQITEAYVGPRGNFRIAAKNG